MIQPTLRFMFTVLLGFAFFGATGIYLLVQLPRWWKLDVDGLMRGKRTYHPLRFGRQSLAAAPGVVVGCAAFTIGGVLLTLDELGLHAGAFPQTARWTLGVVIFGMMAVSVSSVYFGHPRWLLLPGVRDPDDYSKFVNGS